MDSWVLLFTVCMSDVINTSMTHTYLMRIRGFLRGLRRLRSSLRPEFKSHREIVVCSWIAQRCDDWLLVSTDQGYQKNLKIAGSPPREPDCLGNFSTRLRVITLYVPKSMFNVKYPLVHGSQNNLRTLIHLYGWRVSEKLKISLRVLTQRSWGSNEVL